MDQGSLATGFGLREIGLCALGQDRLADIIPAEGSLSCRTAAWVDLPGSGHKTDMGQTARISSGALTLDYAGDRSISRI